MWFLQMSVLAKGFESQRVMLSDMPNWGSGGGAEVGGKVIYRYTGCLQTFVKHYQSSVIKRSKALQSLSFLLYIVMPSLDKISYLGVPGESAWDNCKPKDSPCTIITVSKG